MIDAPLITIVTPVANGAYTLRRAIESIRIQDYPNIEHIIMDAGSTDGTLEIVREYQANLTLYSEPDDGQSDALNRGFARSKGDYLTWLNADDILTPGALTRCIQLFREYPNVALVYGRLNRINRDGIYLHDDYNVFDGTREDLLQGDNFISQPGNLFTRQAWEACGPLRVDLHYCMDVDLWIKMTAKFPIKYTPEVLAEQGHYPTTKSSSGGLKRFHEIREMIEGHGGSAAHTYYKIGLWHYQQNLLPQARHYFRIALRRGSKPHIRRAIRSCILKSYLGPTMLDIGRTLHRPFVRNR
jgi:glycosyltransferase involved in cell wall biosynthesis